MCRQRPCKLRADFLRYACQIIYALAVYKAYKSGIKQRTSSFEVLLLILLSRACFIEIIKQLSCKLRQPFPALRPRVSGGRPGQHPSGPAHRPRRGLGADGPHRLRFGQCVTGAPDHSFAGDPFRHPGPEPGQPVFILLRPGVPEGPGLLHRAFQPSAGPYEFL